MNQKNFDTLAQRIRELRFEEHFDAVVAIANGGIIPAAMINQNLQLDFYLLKINFRDAMQRPCHERPQLMQEIDFPVEGKRILLVEDRVKTGQTLVFAKELLEQHGAAMVKTLAVNGKADYALYDEDCFKFPWIIF